MLVYTPTETATIIFAVVYSNKLALRFLQHVITYVRRRKV